MLNVKVNTYNYRTSFRGFMFRIVLLGNGNFEICDLK